METEENGGENLKKITTIFIMVTLLTLLPFAVPISAVVPNEQPIVATNASAEYDPWLDSDHNGIIDIFDIVRLCNIYGSTGTPINTTQLLLDLNISLTELDIEIQDLQNQINALADLESRCRIIPNGDFEKGIAMMAENDIIDWNYELVVHKGNLPIEKHFYINNTHYYNRFQSLYTYIKTQSVAPFPGDALVSQYLRTEQPAFTTADYITLWIGGYGYTTSSRYDNHVALQLTDGNETSSVVLRLNRWEMNYNYYDETEIGNDGNTWYRYTREIPSYLDKSNLTVTIQHYQASWDLTTTSSWFYLDNICFSDALGNPVP